MTSISDRTDLLVVRTARTILFACFFLSGATGLMYEIVWVRLFSLVFGNTVYSTAAVIAAFMGGLGAGGWWAGNFIEKRRDAVKYYAAAEFVIGVYAFVPGLAVKLLEKAYPVMYSGLGGSAAGLVIVKAAVALLVLAVPTFCMGATLPILVRFFVSRHSLFGNSVSALYGLNTLGAVAGTFFTGFFLLRFFGMRDTLLFGMIINMGIGLLALVQHRKLQETEDKMEDVGDLSAEEAGGEEDLGDGRGNVPALPVLAAVFVTGCVSLSLEVAWTRVLALIIGSSVYAFTLILLTFLLGISLGSMVAGWMFRMKSDLLKRNGLAALGVCLLLSGITAAAGLPLLRWCISFLVVIVNLSSENYYPVLLGQFAVCVIILIVPAMLFGISFPLAATLFSSGTKRISSGLGRVYFWNTLGAILGSISTGFFLIPIVGIHATLVVGLVVLLAAGAILTGIESRIPMKTRAIWALVSAVLVLGVVAANKWDREMMTSGPYPNAHWMMSSSIDGRLKLEIDSMDKLLFYSDGLSSTVSVRFGDNNISLQVNGKTDASNRDADTQLAVGLLPTLLHNEGPKDLAMIGLGSGMTVGATLQVPTVRKVDVVEIEKAVLKAAEFFKDYNLGALTDDRVNIYVEDGRNFFLTHRDRYDVIISEPSNHWIAGVADLYTQDFFRMAAARLNEGGVFCQWIQSYRLSPESLRMFLTTFSSVFQHTYVFLVTSDLIVLGSNEPLDIDARKTAIRFKETGIQELKGLLSTRLDDYGILAAHYMAGPEQVHRLSAYGTIHTDNRPELGYAAPFEYFMKTDAIFDMITKIYPLDTEKAVGLDRLDLSADDYFGIAEEIFFIQPTGRDMDKYLNKALDVDPLHIDTQMLLAERAVKDKKPLEAVSHFHAAMEAGAGMNERLRFVFYLLDQGGVDEADRVIAPLLGQGETAGVLHARALIRQGQGRYFEAADFHLRAAALIDEGLVKSQSLFAAYDNLKKSGKGDALLMREVLTGAYRLRPTNAVIALEFARQLLADGDIPGATAAIVPAVQANPRHVGLEYFMMELQSFIEAPARAAPGQ